jgi:CRISPR/Cas system-associated protein endoribonuclease Cas2
MIEFTDKQYERIRTFKGKNRYKNKLEANQLDLF